MAGRGGMDTSISGRISSPATRLGLPTVAITDPLGTPPQLAGVPLPSPLKQWGLCSEKRPFSPCSHHIVSILAEPVGPTKTHKRVQIVGLAINGC